MMLRTSLQVSVSLSELTFIPIITLNACRQHAGLTQDEMCQAIASAHALSCMAWALKESLTIRPWLQLNQCQMLHASLLSFADYFSRQTAPNVLLTTCYKPSKLMFHFLADMLEVLPCAQFFKRQVSARAGSLDCKRIF